MLSVSLNPVTFTKHEIIMKEVQIMDEDKDFVKPRLNSKFYNPEKFESYSKYRPLGIHCTSASIQDGTCIPYGTITIKSGNEVHTILRVYPKLFSSLSELGGFGGLIFILLNFLVYFINKFQMEKYIKKSVPNIDSLGKYGRDYEKELDKEEIEKKILEEKMSSFEIMTTTTTFEGFCLAVLDQNSYEESLNLIPYLERISGKEEEKIDPQFALEQVLKSQPKNELEKLIKEKIEELIKPFAKGKDDGEEGFNDEIDIFNFASQNRKKIEAKSPEIIKKKGINKLPGENRGKKRGLLHRRRMKRKNLD